MPGPQGSPFDTPIVLRSWYGRQAPEASVVGDQLKFQFVHDMSALLGDVRLFFMPDSADTTTNTDLSRHGVTITYDGSVAGNLNKQGSGLFWQLDGSADEADLVDNARYSFGDGNNDEPFTILALINPDDTTPAAQNSIFSKWDLDTDAQIREYTTYLSATNGYPTMELYDESANASIGRADNTALSSGFHLVGFTYDATEANSGINVFVDAVELDDADVSGGSYTAMEDLGTLPQIGFRLSAAGTPVPETFFNGGMAMITLSQGALSVHEMEATVNLVNGFFDLAL